MFQVTRREVKGRGWISGRGRGRCWVESTRAELWEWGVGGERCKMMCVMNDLGSMKCARCESGKNRDTCEE